MRKVSPKYPTGQNFDLKTSKIAQKCRFRTRMRFKPFYPFFDKLYTLLSKNPLKRKYGGRFFENWKKFIGFVGFAKNKRKRMARLGSLAIRLLESVSLLSVYPSGLTRIPFIIAFAFPAN